MYGKSTSIDNSIPQNTKSVKSKTTTNKQSMQKIETIYRKFSKDFKEKGYIDLNNKKISNVQEVADIAQVFRNPNYETFRILYTKGNTIVGQEAISSRIPGRTKIFEDNNETKGFYKIKDRMKRLNADGYYMIHNHPSGKAVASQIDINTTQKFRKNVQGFKAHIIVNSGTYAVIELEKGKLSRLVTSNEITIENYKPDEIDKMINNGLWSDIKVNSNQQIAKIVHDIKNNPNYSIMILADSKLFPRVVLDIPNSFFNMKRSQIDGYIKNIARQNGTNRAFIATTNNDVYKSTNKLTTITDSILYSTKGNDIYEENSLSKKDTSITEQEVFSEKDLKIKNTNNQSTKKTEQRNINADGVRYMKKNLSKSNTIQNNTNPTSNQDIRFAKKTVKPVNEVLEPGQRNAERESNYIEQEIRKIEQTGDWDDSIPVTKMTDIRKTIEDYLGIGVQKGRFRQQAYGIYKGTRDVIRTKELKDMDTILHETGHALDIGNRIKINKESISNELLKAVDNYGGYEAETRQVQLEEGFAEVIREYTIAPVQARIDYPQTVSVLEGIRQENKDFDNFIRNVQEQTYNYIHQNPRNRTLSNVSIGEQTDKRVWTRASTTETIMRAIYDKDWSLKSAVNELQKVQGKTTQDLRASENAYYLTRLSSGIGGKITSMLSNGYIDENGNKLMPGLNQLGEILGNDPQRFDDLRAYLVAQRDLEYKVKTLKTGIRTMDSKAVVAQFKKDTQIQEAAKLVYDTLNGVMQYAVNNGLITQENANLLKKSNVFYIPMQRVLEGNKNNVGRRGAVVDIIKARTGSELDVKDVLENIVSNSANIIQQVENNNILKALYKQGEQAGITGKIYDVISTPMVKVGTAKLSTWKSELKNQGVDITDIDFDKTIDLFAPNNKVDTKNLITSFINDDGKRVYLQFNDDVLFNSLMNMDRKFMSTILNINKKFNMPLRYGATMANIGFAIPNVISDTAQATIFSDAGFIPVVDNLIGVMDIVSAQNKTAREFFNKIIPRLC